MKKVFVTGGTGMIGLAFVRSCIRENIDVYILVREGSAHLKRLPKSGKVHIIKGDLKHLDRIDALSIGSCDAFYHFGWIGTVHNDRNKAELQEENIPILLQALNLAKQLGCRSFIGSGSQAEYGVHSDNMARSDTITDPITAYGICKLAASKLGRIKAAELGLNFVWMRIFSVYGPYEMSGTLTRMIIPKLMNNESCQLTEGIQHWDYLYCDDAGEAFLLVGKCTEKKTGYFRIFCLGSGKLRSLRSYIEEMKYVLRSDSILEFGKIPYANEIPNGICADISELKTETGWMPRTDFKTGILNVKEWIKKGVVK